MLITSLLQRIIISLAIVTAFGILVHDTKFDEAVALAVPVGTITIGIGLHALDSGDSAHTHVERASITQPFSGNPRIQARDDHRRYIISKHSSRNSFFGSNGILWPSV
ncbi:MAG: hypothetical protein H6797_05765 [Candidatus Nomurabacteria bacterium]|nr:MAG: hypothetical protein H6797_05765 [Candidatus Nomurabacteria bacterium]